MSTIKQKEVKCGACGNTIMTTYLTSTNAFGSMDLDYRPPEMKRSTMVYWVDECPHCGYVSNQIDKDASFAKDLIKSETYFIFCDTSFKNDLAVRFVRWGMINRLLGDTKSEFYACLYAAWACDDYREPFGALQCRKHCLSLIDTLIDAQSDHDTLILIKLDLLRRTKQYDKLLAEYSELKLRDELYNNIISFQLDRARAHDPACYKVSDTEARKP